MDSGTVGANDSRYLSARERFRWDVQCKVYTRKNFRKKTQLEISNNDSATTTSSAAAAAAAEPSVATEPTADVKPTSSSPAKDDLAANESTLRSPSGEALDAGDGHFSEKQPQPAPSRSEGEPSTSDGVRQPEDNSRAGEAISSGGEGPPASHSVPEVRVQEEREVLPDGHESAPDGGEEPPLSSGHEAPHQALPNGGQDTVPNGGEELQSPLRNGPESLSEPQNTGEQESVPDIREEPPVEGQSEVAAGQEAAAEAAKGREEVQLTVGRVSAPSDEGSHVPGTDRPVNGVASAGLVNGLSKPVITRVEDRVRINISGSLKVEMRKLKRKLENELDHVRNIVEKIQAKELQLNAYNTSNVSTNSRYVGGTIGNLGGGYSQPQLTRANSELGAVGHLYSRPQLARVNSEVGSVGYQETRPFRHLSVSVMENNHGVGGVGEFVEKEKRTPKANQFYRNSEFLLGKDRLPPESNKKLKLNCGGKKHGGNAEYAYGYGYQNRDKVFKSCSNLLQRLMKHKHAWVFNEPVDAKKLNIPDYHIIIKHPMDFGTIKSRLAQNWYKSAREFAEDVRLVFRNAMIYNPKGQDVHVMAEELSNIFEEKWLAIEKEYYPYQIYYDAGLPIPTPRRAPPPPVFPPAPVLAPVLVPPMRSLDRSESMTMPVDSRLKPSNSNLSHGGRTPVPKKPKAKDPNKRDMTYDEKQKLSTNLQSLPPEKLDAIVQIIKKRNTALSQHDDEIEVDIDSVDAETLWELDRFVTNYKKSLSKNKRKAELALQRKAAAAQAAQSTNPVPAVVEAQTESRTGEKINPPVVEVEKQGDNVSGSSSSSSSSSDSGSSSSDSDSESSSAYGSDAGHSPKT